MDFWTRLDEKIDEISTRKEVAAAVGINPRFIFNWKDRKTYPAADIAVKLAKALDTTVEYLVDGVYMTNPVPMSKLDLYDKDGVQIGHVYCVKPFSEEITKLAGDLMKIDEAGLDAVRKLVNAYLQDTTDKSAEVGAG